MPIEKAKKAEIDALVTLELRFNCAQTGLKNEQDKAHMLNERTATSLLQGLEEAIKAYEFSITSILTIAGGDKAKKNLLSTKLCDQMTKVNPVIDDLHNKIKNLREANNPPETVNDLSNKVKAKIQVKIKFTRKTVENRLNQIHNDERQEDTRALIPKIRNNLTQLNELQDLVDKELDIVCSQFLNGELKQEDVDQLQTFILNL